MTVRRELNELDFLYRRSLFGFRNRSIIISIPIFVDAILLFISILIAHEYTLFYAVLIFYYILFLYVLRQISKNEKAFKKITGHYSLFPPREGDRIIEDKPHDVLLSFFNKRSLFGFERGKIVSMTVIMTGMFTLILLTSKIPPGRFFLGLELLLALMGLIFIVSKIVEAEREIKRITGHYQLIPPSGIYD